MVESLNTRADLTTDGISFLGIGARYGKILIGDHAFEFFNEKNIQDYIQIPWSEVNYVQAQVSHNKIGRRFKFNTTIGELDFSSKDAGKILKGIREYIGNDKVVRAPTLWQKIKNIFLRLKFKLKRQKK